MTTHWIDSRGASKARVIKGKAILTDESSGALSVPRPTTKRPAVAVRPAGPALPSGDEPVRPADGLLSELTGYGWEIQEFLGPNWPLVAGACACFPVVAISIGLYT